MGHSMTPKQNSDFKTLDRKNMTTQCGQKEIKEQNLYNSERPGHKKLKSRGVSPKNEVNKTRGQSKSSVAKVKDSKIILNSKLQQARAEK